MDHTNDIRELCAAAGLEEESYQTFGATVSQARGAGYARLAPAPSIPETLAPPVSVIREPKSESRESRPRPALANRLQGRGSGARKLQGIAFCAASGGAGSTTVTSSLARILAKRSENVAVADNHAMPSAAFQFGASSVARGTWSLLPQRRGTCGAVHIFSRPETLDSKFGWLAETVQTFPHSWDRMLINAGWQELDEIAAHDLGGFTPVVVVGPNPVALMRMPLILDELAAGKQTPFVLLNRFDRNKDFHGEMERELRARYGRAILPFTIRESDLVAEAAVDGIGITEYAPESEVAMDYLRLADWIQVQEARHSQGDTK